ncbi:MAG: [FeFe] hydrogenase H-cluster radical SAM maturase HydE [Polyangiaceae bacterium]|nr:[FeFe] hydrogenase H-cluster radical SAM maturase HydE [Polyangiaceae bacterium]
MTRADEPLASRAGSRPTYLPPAVEVARWLQERDPLRLKQLWARADEVRQQYVGADVHLRGLVEVSNHCVRQCHYCGLRAGHRTLPRYRMSADEVLACARQARAFGFGTVVLQAGEDPVLRSDWISEVVRRVKATTGLAVTLSLGERTREELEAWREAGADRYLLRFETSDSRLFRAIHPSRAGQARSRLRCLGELRSLGYEVGSGVMVGLPGQSYASLVDDVMLFREYDLDMVAIGPFVVHPDTPLGSLERGPREVPADELMTTIVVALARLACPQANIPSTTALATLNLTQGHELGLCRGANVVMPNLTPARYRRLYDIYPSKACLFETAEQCAACVRRRVESIGRRVGTGPGGRRRAA